MKVLLFNGSPREAGCTYTALQIIEAELQERGIETEIIHTGKVPVHAAVGHSLEVPLLVETVEKAKSADGFIFGSPVHYAAMSASLKTFMDQLFFDNGKYLAYKPGAAIVSARRAGTTAALEQIQKYLNINNMPIVSSQYWPMVHGSTSSDVLKDEEGVQIMQVLGRNMAWLLKCIDAGKKQGIEIEEVTDRKRTNFIRKI